MVPKRFQWQKIQKCLFVWKFKVFQRWLKSFWSKIDQFFSYCPVKKCKSFWIFVSIFFHSMKTPNFEFPSASCFVLISSSFLQMLSNVFENWWQNTMLVEIQKLESSLSEKKFKQRFKNFYTFLLDNKKRIDRSCFKTILTTPEFSQINTLNFLSLKKLQEDHYWPKAYSRFKELLVGVTILEFSKPVISMSV